jgi:pimeloyl-ACP methyl ester carboxylesterase
MASATPTIVLVPSSFCPSALLWNKTIDNLREAGYDTVAIELPSVGPPSTAPAKTMLEDAAHIHGTLEYLANEGSDILLVMYSYGSIPGLQALETLTAKERAAQGKEGGVIGLVHITGLLLEHGKSLGETFASLGISPPGFFRPVVRE